LTEEALRQLERLDQNLKSLLDEKASFTKEAERWAQNRDQIHRQIRDLRLEATALRERRDALNTRVGMLKARRNETRASIKEKHEEITQLEKRVQRLGLKKPEEPAEAIRKEKEKIEWDIQTTSLTLQEEKPLVRRATLLELQLGIHKQIHDAKARIVELRREVHEMRADSNLSHQKLSELAQESQQLHLKMVETQQKAEKLQAEADEHHQVFLQNKRKAQNIHIDCSQIKEKIRVLRKQITEDREQEKISRANEKRRKLKSEALRKLAAGKKLTLEEFKLTSEDEI
jgi:uncharacterized coiled-coil DUF342 family protein